MADLKEVVRRVKEAEKKMEGKVSKIPRVTRNVGVQVSRKAVWPLATSTCPSNVWREPGKIVKEWHWIVDCIGGQGGTIFVGSCAFKPTNAIAITFTFRGISLWNIAAGRRPCSTNLKLLSGDSAYWWRGRGKAERERNRKVLSTGSHFRIMKWWCPFRHSIELCMCSVHCSGDIECLAKRQWEAISSNRRRRQGKGDWRSWRNCSCSIQEFAQHSQQQAAVGFFFKLQEEYFAFWFPSQQPFFWFTFHHKNPQISNNQSGSSEGRRAGHTDCKHWA